MRPLVHVLIGRDAAPAWRSATTRRAAQAVAWLGWALLAASALAASALTHRYHGTAASAGPGALGWLAVALAVSAALPAAPGYALLAWRVAYLGVLVTPLIPGQTRADAGKYAVLAIVYVVAGLRYGPSALWWMAALTLVPVWLWTGPDWVYPAELTIGLAVLAAALHGIVNWRRDRQALEAQTRSAEQQRERNAVLEERARIAREMHDVVAHHMSMIAVQAETAPYRLAGIPGMPGAADAAGVPGPVAAEFAALSCAAREALTEMRRLLGVLRNDSDGGEAERVPQPDIRDVPELVDSARRAGTLVSLEMPPDTAGITPGAGLTAYRIVQESLSNAARHAPGARISVVVGQEPRSVLLTIKNGPAATGQPRADGTGHGLAGMRERVALLGGELSAGPEADGGFAVRATLPVADPRQAADPRLPAHSQRAEGKR